jgi:hypothetical protein
MLLGGRVLLIASGFMDFCIRPRSPNQSPRTSTVAVVKLWASDITDRSRACAA